jgi:RNA polymerase sigma factor (sigma-70 family)
MTKFDGTIDNSYRPDLPSSQRRVHEEEVEDAAVEVRYSRELSFVPSTYKPDTSAHDAPTRALIEEQRRLEQKLHGSQVAGLMETWKCKDAMATVEEKQHFLEGHIYAVQQDPVKNEGRLIFLMLALEPIRRGISKRFIEARGGYNEVKDFCGSHGADLRLVHDLDREAVFDVTRKAALEAVFRYPSKPVKLFAWFKETISFRVLDELKRELPDIETSGVRGAEARAVSGVLAGLMELDPPEMRSDLNLGAWMQKIVLRDIFDTVEDFYDFSPVRNACNKAIGKLSPGQGAVIRALYWEEKTAEKVAEDKGVTRSTIDNHASKGRKKMHDDDEFFTALDQMGYVRDAARAKERQEKYPDGVMPDGRRIVSIAKAA